MNDRLWYFDNLKFWLMVSVILHHCSLPFLILNGDRWVSVLYTMIMPCTMSLFTMISGFFFKERKTEDVVSSYLIPCILFSIVYIIWARFSPVSYMHDNPVSRLGYAMWYLWVLFFYNLITPYLLAKYKIEFIIAASIVSAFFLCQCPGIEANDFHSSRFFSHYPFFLIGLFLNKSGYLIKGRNDKRVRYGAFLVFFSLWLFNIFFCYKHPNYTFIPAFDVPLPAFKVFYGLFMCIALSVCALLIVPNKRRWYSSMGARTKTPYLLHMSIVFPICWVFGIPLVNSSYGIAIFMIITPVLCLWLFSEKADCILNKVLSFFH